MKKRIFFDARHLSSGIGSYIRGLLDCYHGVVPELPMEIVLIGDPAKLLPEYSGFRVIESTIPIYTIREQLILPFVLRGTDLLHVPHYNVPLVFPNRFVVTIHDVAHLALPGIFRNPVKKACARLLLRETARRSRYVITVSRFSKEEIVKYLGINEEKIRVIYNGVAPEFFRNPANRTSGDVLPNRGISRPYLLYVGNIKPHKNLERMASAFEKIRKDLPCAHDLVIVGSGTGKLKERLMGRDHIRIIENCGIKELVQLYRGAAALILVSIYEGFGFPPLEAMACGTPVLVSDLPVFREIIGDAGLFADPVSEEDIAGKIVRLTTDADIRETLVGRGFKRAAMFSWRKAAEKTLALYEAACDGTATCWRDSEK